MITTITVQVSIPVSMDFDEPPSLGVLRHAALENFIAHPALKNISDLEMYVDSIGNGELDITETCRPCNGKGWLVVEVDGNPENTRIERCNSCFRFATDAEAVSHAHLNHQNH